MRTLRFLNLAILSLLVGSAALVYAQEDKQQQEKPARQEEAKPQPKQEEANPPRQENQQDRQVDKQDQRRGQEQSHDQAMPDRQEHPGMHDERAPQGQGREDRPEARGERGTQGQEHPKMEGDHAGQGQGRPGQRAENGRPAGKRGHIPDDRFRSQFGREHHFNAKTVIVSGQPQFQYGGYSFELVDAWPVDWAYTDDVYIDYIDGDYFLFDLLHPGVRIAVFVVM